MRLRATDDRAQMIADLQGEVALLKCALRVAAGDYIESLNLSAFIRRKHQIEKWKAEAIQHYPGLSEVTR